MICKNLYIFNVYNLDICTYHYTPSLQSRCKNIHHLQKLLCVPLLYCCCKTLKMRATYNKLLRAQQRIVNNKNGTNIFLQQTSTIYSPGITVTLYPLNNNPLLHFPPSPDHHHSIFYFGKFACFT